MLQLIQANEQYLSQVEEYREEFLAAGDSMDGTGPLRRCNTAAEWLKETNLFLAEETVPAGLVMATQFLAVRKEDDRLVGMIHVRHTLNDHLAKFGGHIGYSVRPSERRKGYAAEMLAAVLPFCHSLGLKKVLVTCDESNEASRKTILKNGGVYDGAVFCDEDSENIEHYWITL